MKRQHREKRTHDPIADCGSGTADSGVRPEPGPAQDAKATKTTSHMCYQCVYGAANPAQAIRNLTLGWPAMLTCVNSVGAPGEMREVMPNRTCRNFRARRKPPVRLDPPEPPDETVRYIALTKGKFAIVDTADYERLSRYKWTASHCGVKWYAARKSKGRTILMHRELMDPPKGMDVDHIDGNGLNNTRGNLRICTRRQNLRNRRPSGGTSRHKGVWYRKERHEWGAAIKSGRVPIHLGNFKEEDEAARAYDRKAVELFGEFAYLNFPDEHGKAPRTQDTDSS